MEPLLAGDVAAEPPALLSAVWTMSASCMGFVSQAVLKGMDWLGSCSTPLSSFSLEQILHWLLCFFSWLADMFTKLLSVLATVGLSLQIGGTHHRMLRCEPSTFISALPKGASLEDVTPVPEGGSFGEGTRNIPYPTNPTELPELCAVIVKVESSPSSSFRFGLFLPSEWTGRFLAVGNGGFSGGINWLDMAPGPHYGMATVSTDTGHNSSAIDMTWALNQPEMKTDWGWRAMSGSVNLGKKLTEAYYDRRIHHSYYNGCSSGGRQGLKQIQLSADVFDGILVGAPAWYTSHGNPWVTQLSKYNLPASDPKHMTFTQFGIIANEVVRQCDRADGVFDFIVSAPELCNFDWNPILCGRPGVDPSRCVTEAQMGTAKNIYSDWIAPDGTFLHPGLSLGSEWNWLLLASDEAPFGLSFVRYYLYDDPFFTLEQFNETVVFDADRLNPGNVTADKYDLSDYKRNGGKIIMYQGMADGIVPLGGSNLYYDRVAEAMGGLYRIYDFFRYFKIPGMQHCWATPENEKAPWYIAGGSQAAAFGSNQWSVPGFRDSKHDAMLALVDWVEKGKAVDSIIATNWANQLDPTTPVIRQRPLCPYPRKQVWNRRGDVNKPENWSCQ